MEDLVKWVSTDVAPGLNELIVRALKVFVVGFVVLQIKELVDAGLFDTAGTAMDAFLIAGGVFLIDAILMMVFRRGAQKPSQARR
jgi:small neutral amino acid transporter SnatA (MarC family)